MVVTLPASRPTKPGLPVVKAPKLEDALPASVQSHVSGGRDLWSEPLASTPEDPVGAVWQALGEVLDPELPISLVDLGLIYGIAYENKDVSIDLTFTATACPCMEFIQEDIRDRLEQEHWIDAVQIEEVWDPPWSTSRITEKGRTLMRTFGVGV